VLNPRDHNGSAYIIPRARECAGIQEVGTQAPTFPRIPGTFKILLAGSEGNKMIRKILKEN